MESAGGQFISVIFKFFSLNETMSINSFFDVKELGQHLGQYSYFLSPKFPRVRQVE